MKTDVTRWLGLLILVVGLLVVQVGQAFAASALSIYAVIGTVTNAGNAVDGTASTSATFASGNNSITILVSPAATLSNLKLLGNNGADWQVTWYSDSGALLGTSAAVTTNGATNWSVAAVVTNPYSVRIGQVKVTALGGNQNLYEVAVTEQTAPADTTAPAIPAGLTVTAGDAQASLSWSAVADADLAGYRVYRDGVKVADVTGTTYTDTGRTNGTTYSYTVTAYDATGNESAQSAAVVATPTAPSPDPDTTPPDAPTGLIATAGELSVSLTWTASQAPDVQGYRIYRDGVLLGSRSAAGYTDTGLQAGRTYSYTVSAVDTAGNESPQSAPASAVPAAPLVAPSAPGSLTATRGDRSVTLRWTPPATGSVESYQVYRDGAPVATTTATTWKDSGLNPETTYRYAVTALNGAGESPMVTAEVTTLRAGGLSGVQSNLSGLTGGLSGAMRILLPFFVLAASLIIASLVLGRGLSWLSARRRFR